MRNFTSKFLTNSLKVLYCFCRNFSSSVSLEENTILTAVLVVS